MSVSHARIAHALVCAAALLAAGTPVVAAEARTVEGLATPESVVVGPDGRIYVSEIGEFDKDGDGSVAVIADGKAVTFCEGLDEYRESETAKGNKVPE